MSLRLICDEQPSDPDLCPWCGGCLNVWGRCTAEWLHDDPTESYRDDGVDYGQE